VLSDPKLGRLSWRPSFFQLLECVGARLIGRGFEVVENALDIGKALNHVVLQGHESPLDVLIFVTELEGLSSSHRALSHQGLLLRAGIAYGRFMRFGLAE
jgi:hypothetical protein